MLDIACGIRALKYNDMTFTAYRVCNCFYAQLRNNFSYKYTVLAFSLIPMQVVMHMVAATNQTIAFFTQKNLSFPDTRV